MDAGTYLVRELGRLGPIHVNAVTHGGMLTPQVENITAALADAGYGQRVVTPTPLSKLDVVFDQVVVLWTGAEFRLGERCRYFVTHWHRNLDMVQLITYNRLRFDGLTIDKAYQGALLIT